MRLSLVLLSLLFFFACAGGCYSQGREGTAEETPQKDDPYTWDFGRIKQGEIVKHTFEFKNNSNRKLTIVTASASCGCTIPTVRNKVLLAQESTDIEVAFRSAGYSGQVKQFVYLDTDDPDNPITKLTIKADVVKPPPGEPK